MDYGTTLDLTKVSLDNRKLYSYQEAATNNLNKYFNLKNPEKQQNGLLVMPTGSGKTFTVVNWLLENAIPKGYKVIWFAHRKDLIEQAQNAFIHRAPVLLKYNIKEFSIMPISGEHYSMSQASKCDAYICSIQSAASNNGFRFINTMLGAKGREKVVIVIDEAHHAVMPSFRKILSKITELNPNRILLGITATPTRMQESEQIRLYKMFDCFEDIKTAKQNKENPRFIYEVQLKDLIANGTLANPRYQKIETNIEGKVDFEISENDEKYYKQYGELSERIKNQLANSSYRNRIIVDEYIKNREKYGKTLVFAVNKAHAYTLDKEFKKAFKENNLDINSEYCLSGDSNNQEKINKFKNQKDGVFINVQILTEGSDVPDIQTVFLTRQTNSEPLLMQMIGRGLRGKAAGGTETLNVVDFHDTWEKFKFWLDPKFIIDGLSGDRENASSSGETITIPWEVTMDIYSRMVANVTSKSNSPIVPHGWYSVIDDEGEDYRIIVFDNQLEAYKNIEDNIEKIDENTIAIDLIKKYFIIQESLPNEDSIAKLIKYINENREMPEYFEFENLKVANSIDIAKYIINSHLDVFGIEEYLEKLFDSNPIFENIYDTVENFTNIIWGQIRNIRNPKTPMTVEYLDKKENYNIEKDYFDLQKLLKEVIQEVKEKNWFKPNENVEIMYTDKPVKGWFGLCTKYEDGSCVIRINNLLSSPMVNQNVIKYLIYHELLHASGFWQHNKEFRKKEWLYENADVYDNFLDRLMIDYDIKSALDEMDQEKSELCGGNKGSNLTHPADGKGGAVISDNGYSEISIENADIIKKIIETTQIEEFIHLEFPAINAYIHIEDISENFYYEEGIYTFGLMYRNYNEKSLSLDCIEYPMMLGVSNWGDEDRIKNGKIYIESPAFGGYFAQLALSQAIEDENYIYIIKNISKLGGKGSIFRLNKNAEDVTDKYLRREILVEKLNNGVINYKNNDWVVVDKILKSDLEDEENYQEIFYNFLENFLKYAFYIEEIIKEY
ncbi:DEAD/DEAH box helicase [Intestinibacter bartlettii]|uniref:DEAD/DEAH box helicase n=1 Tax=Intestinibacter bartlettii TaxID=261299 RepID=UPI0022E777BE|nr:DEAD/DEAH box helicase [Intestinibacter bartlettii]